MPKKVKQILPESFLKYFQTNQKTILDKTVNNYIKSLSTKLIAEVLKMQWHQNALCYN